MIIGKNDIKCGLIGGKLGHSFSPQIHRRLADYSYRLFELEEHEVGDFLKNGDFDAINVTIPYKKTVMPFLSRISDEAVSIGSVNTVTRDADGNLVGDNTDYFGFSYLVRRSGIDVCGKHVVILGTGGASLTARAVCRDLGASALTFVSRSGDVNYENVYDVCQADSVIVNCTPVGMFPANGRSPVDLSRFKCCVGVIDMIYNPSKTKLLLDAERLGIPNINGLPMLVAQAKRACELFLGADIDDSEIDRIEREVRSEMENIVLIGMPGCGKSTVAYELSRLSGREVIDTDALTEKNEGMSIPQMFSERGEEYFRAAEHRAISEAGKQSGKIIATGGGAVTRSENYEPLTQNGRIFFIKRDIGALSRDDRPLSQGADLEKMYSDRLPMYMRFCDHEVENRARPDDCANEILKILKKETEI